MLPGVLNRTEVVNIAYEQLSPIANAISEVINATRNLRLLTRGRGDQPVE